MFTLSLLNNTDNTDNTYNSAICLLTFDPKIEKVQSVKLIAAQSNLITDEKVVQVLTGETGENPKEKPEEKVICVKKLTELFDQNDLFGKMKESIEKNNIEQINLLLELGADLHHYDCSGKNALFYALYNKNHEIAEMLIKKGTDVNKVIDDEQIVFNLIRSSKVEELKFLLKHGLNLNVCTVDFDKIVPLGLAAYNREFEIVELFVENGADINKCNKYNQSPLFLAVCENDYKIAKFLIEKGADVNIQVIGTCVRFNALHGAVLGRTKKITKLLLKNGARYDENDNYWSKDSKLFIEEMKKKVALKNTVQGITQNTVQGIAQNTVQGIAQNTQQNTTQINEKSLENSRIKTSVPFRGKSYPYEGSIELFPKFLETVLEFSKHD